MERSCPKKPASVQVTRSPFWKQAKEHVGGKRRGVREDKGWHMLVPILFLDPRLHHSGRRAPVRGARLSLRSAWPLRQLKPQFFLALGKGRVLLSLKGKSLPLPGFRLACVGPTASRAAGGLAAGGEPRGRRAPRQARGPPEPPGGRWGPRSSRRPLHLLWRPQLAHL